MPHTESNEFDLNLRNRIKVFYNSIAEKEPGNEYAYWQIFVTFAAFPSRRTFFIRNERLGGNVYIHKRRY